jgi:N-acetylglutamate synthase-like GNAT family acetyltransferase
MIRQATKYDKTEIIEMLKCFRDESPIKQYFQDDDIEHWEIILTNVFAGQGKIFIEQGKGLFFCLLLPSIWSKKVLVLHEIAWYVLPQYRNGTSGYKLLKAYLEYANKLKNSGRIKYFTLSKIATSPNLKYEKLGFRKIDENWIQ